MYFRSILLILLGVHLARPASAVTSEQLLANRFDPRFEYETLETPHFSIHYPLHLGSTARSLARKAERAHEKVSASLDWNDDGKTHLVVMDQSDQPGVFTLVFPHRQIFLDVALPHQGLGLNDYADFHDWVLTHEYSHLAHFEMRRGLYRALSPVLGSWIRPNLGLPTWIKEGLAVYLETALTPRGRGGGSTYRMMMRVAHETGTLRDPRFASADTIANFENQSWPWTLRPYLFGYYLVRTIAERTSGLKAATVWSTSGSAPYRADAFFRSAGFGSMRELWDAALKRISEEAEKELLELRDEPLTKLELLTRTGQIHSGLALSPDGKTLIASRDHPGVANSIFKIPLDGDEWGKAQELLPRATGYQVSFSKSGRFLLYDQTARAQRHHFMGDIYIFDLKEKRLVSVSPYFRARDPDAHPDGKHIVFVANENGENHLVMTDTSWNHPRYLLSPGRFSRISGPRFSPDGDRIAASVHNPDTGGEDLWLVSDSGAQPIVSDSALNLHPSWTPDGEYLLYSSDASGVSNIRALRLSDRKVFELSHVSGGLFYPVADAGHRWVYVSSYGAEGYDVARFRWDPSAWKSVKPAATQVGTASLPEPKPGPSSDPSAGAGPRLDSSPLRSGPYGRASYLLPQYLRPSLSFQRYSSQLGFEIGAVDPLFFESYSLALRYDTGSDLPVGKLTYFNGRRTLAWELSLAHSARALPGASSSLSQFRGELTASLPLERDSNDFFFRSGALVQGSGRFDVAPEAGPHAGLRMDTRYKDFGQSFPEYGKLVDLDLRELFRLGEGFPASTSATLRLETHHAVPILKRHALHLSLEAGALLLGDTGQAQLFATGGQDSFPYAPGESFTLYGYPPDFSLSSASIALANAFHTFPILDISRGPGLFPVFFGRLSGGLRLQGSVIETRSGVLTPWSAGFELHQDLLAGHVFGMVARLGFYHGPRSLGGENQMVFTLSGTD